MRTGRWLRRLRRCLQTLEIRNYDVEIVRGLSETKASCPLPVSVLSIVPDFLVVILFTQLQDPRQIQIYNGSFAGTPAFLGYFPGVFLTLSICTSDRPISVPGSINRLTVSIFPPSRSTAFSDCLISSSESPLL